MDRVHEWGGLRGFFFFSLLFLLLSAQQMKPGGEVWKVGEEAEPGRGLGLACARVVTGQRSGKLTKATDSTLGMSWEGWSGAIHSYCHQAIVVRSLMNVPTTIGIISQEALSASSKRFRKLWKNQYEFGTANGKAKENTFASGQPIVMSQRAPSKKGCCLGACLCLRPNLKPTITCCRKF